MIKKKPHEGLVKSFAKKMRNTWQMFFLPGLLGYALSLMHRLYEQPAPSPGLRNYMKNLDLVSFIIAVGLTVVIFNLKRRYFSARFSKTLVAASLQENPQQDSGDLLRQVLLQLAQKMRLIWGLALLVILDGIIFYWVTFSPGNAMHIYFVIGTFSMLVNYPRSELFEDLPWYVTEAQREYGRRG